MSHSTKPTPRQSRVQRIRRQPITTHIERSLGTHISQKTILARDNGATYGEGLGRGGAPGAVGPSQTGPTDEDDTASW